MGQSVRTQFGASGGGQVIGCANLIEIGTWSDPVEGRSVAHSWKKGIRAGDANARSRTEDLEDPWSGKPVCTPGMFRRVYPYSAALEKYGKEVLSSEELCFLRGSADGW